MQAYRIDRFGTVDGIVLRSSDDSRPGTEGGSDASARELAQLLRTKNIRCEIFHEAAKFDKQLALLSGLHCPRFDPRHCLLV